jgi:hypothetical protein
MEKPNLLAPEQLRALDLLSRVPALDGYYLAGGTAIALHLGHRQSLDLDFSVWLPTPRPGMCAGRLQRPSIA